MNVLIACEESQRVCEAFRTKGHTAYSCDIEKCGGEHPEWHINGDVLPLLNGKCSFITQDGAEHKIENRWDLIIAHPPCTYLTVTGNRWFDTGKYGKAAWDRMTERNKAIGFFYRFVMADCDHIAIENPCGIMSTAYRSPDQTIQPYMFGDPFEKKTCFWLKGLPALISTNEVKPPKRKEFDSGKTMPAWYSDLFGLPKEERSKARSRTFPGVAAAMAEQWGDYVVNVLTGGEKIIMLKIYDLIYSVSIDGGPWKRLAFDTNWFVSDENLPEVKLLLDDVSFQEAYDYLCDNYISGARTCKSIFKGNPQISLLYFNDGNRTYIKKCEGFWLRAENRLRKNVTLDWIMKNLPANMAIQYFKEREMKVYLESGKNIIKKEG